MVKLNETQTLPTELREILEITKRPRGLGDIRRWLTEIFCSGTRASAFREEIDFLQEHGLLRRVDGAFQSTDQGLAAVL